MHYVSGKREGWSIAYFENGMHEIEGAYGNNLRDGSWKFFNMDGDLRFELIYDKGELKNPEVLDAIQQKEFDEMEKSRGNLRDPEDFINNPDEYIRP
jgi:antitoxin component YwqK of YwqJK toxin-antitoxin module